MPVLLGENADAASANPDSSGKLLRGEGLHVVMERINGVTARDVLRQPFLFQCPPLESFRRSYGFQWTDYSVLHAPRSRPSQAQLTAITFQTLFLDGGYEFTLIDPAPLNIRGKAHPSWRAHDADDALSRTAELLRIMRSGTPFHLSVGNPLFLPENESPGRHEVDMDATLRTLEVEERAGEPESRYVDVSFVEYLGAERAKETGKLPVKLKLATLPKHKNTMHKLALAYYAEPSKWKLIAKRNPFLKGVGANVNLAAKYKHSKQHKFVVIPKET